MCLYGDEATREALVGADVIAALVECTKPSAGTSGALVQVSKREGLWGIMHACMAGELVQASVNNREP